MASDSKVLYVYRCPECSHRGEQHHADDSQEGGASTCSACGAAVTLEWDGGVTFDTAHQHDAEDMDRSPDPADLRDSGAQIVPGKCVGGRTEHLMEPEWRGRGFDHMRCHWCGKREPV